MTTTELQPRQHPTGLLEQTCLGGRIQTLGTLGELEAGPRRPAGRFHDVKWL